MSQAYTYFRDGEQLASDTGLAFGIATLVAPNPVTGGVALGVGPICHCRELASTVNVYMCACTLSGHSGTGPWIH